MVDNLIPKKDQILLAKIDVFFQDETVWLTQKMMAELFDVDVRTVNEHLQNVYQEGELDKKATIRKFRIVRKEGNREVMRKINFYNLDAIISVGYRVNSVRATQFRIWTTRNPYRYIISSGA